MTTTMEINAHNVKSIEICRSYVDCSNSRTIRITTSDGEFEITMYGNTDALDTLPRSSDFKALHRSSGWPRAA